ncbi:MAG: ParA family protein [Clostridia bacterium]|nr:ParA family protein [Clostridia bacterium]
MKTIAFCNQKGGVGKTTSSLVVADILASIYNKRVLIIDLDPQLNTSTGLGVYEAGAPCVAHLLVDKEYDVEKTIKHTRNKNIDVIPCDKGLDLANQQALMDTTNVLQFRLRSHIRKVRDRYDYCILDCPTAVKNVSTINGLAFTDDVIIPISADSYSLDGLKDVIKVIDDIKEYNDNIRIRGAFITVFENTNICREVEASVREALGDLAFKTHIRKCVKVKESTFAEQSLLEYAKDCTAVVDYLALVKEYLE